MDSVNQTEAGEPPSAGASPQAGPTDEDYARLLALRVRLRRFERWSRAAAAEVGLTHAQHQLLLAVRGHDGVLGPTLGEVAAYLLVSQPAASELVERTVELGLVRRERDVDDARRVRLRLTTEGDAVVRRLTAVHLDELRALAPALGRL